ncbi:SAM-dependent methlyltransferase [Candidatus Magnetomorum sp. HK-1]|nr:SAM-dependent methlyltransferase [Candidatus Magnetomorum sp. HK-1]
MFNPIPPAIRDRMHFLEEIDSRDRNDGTPFEERLRQIPPESGKFLALLAANNSPPGDILEVGTSAGYSTLWLSMACQCLNRRITTFEIAPGKIALAKETFRQAQVEDWINLECMGMLVSFLSVILR